MRIYTIGFTKKSAKEFFEKLKKNNVKTLIDIRLNNKSQLAGFSKGEDLKYFLEVIADIKYIHDIKFAPTENILKRYQDKEMSWQEYEKEYIALLLSRDILHNFDLKILESSCLLCSEPTPEKCHRRLLAEYFANNIPEIEIVHI